MLSEVAALSDRGKAFGLLDQDKAHRLRVLGAASHATRLQDASASSQHRSPGPRTGGYRAS